MNENDLTPIGITNYRSTNQKFGEIATAVITAIFGSGICTPAINCGITNIMIPLANPSVAFDSPISQTGGRWRIVLRQTSGKCPYPSDTPIRMAIKLILS